MDWKAITNNVLLVGSFVAMVTMFNQVNARIDALNGRIDQLQTETNRQFDEMRAESDRRFDEMNRRFDTMQAESQRQHDALQAENQRRHDAMGKELGERLRQEHFSRGEPLIIGRNGVAMLKHPDGRITPLDGK